MGYYSNYVKSLNADEMEARAMKLWERGVELTVDANNLMFTEFYSELIPGNFI